MPRLAPDRSERLAQEALVRANERAGYTRYALVPAPHGGEFRLTVTAEFTGNVKAGGRYQLPHELQAVLDELEHGTDRYLQKRPALAARTLKKAQSAPKGSS